MAHHILPDNPSSATLIARVWDPVSGGPRVCVVRGDELVDITPAVGTVSNLCDHLENLEAYTAGGDARWSIDEVVENSAARNGALPHFLAPVDLQVVKACGVTFVGSLIERVIEEKCAGDSARAEVVRAELMETLDGSLKGIRPGSAKAQAAKEVLIAQGLWSPYLEVGIGPDPEVFTKAPVLSSVGFGAKVGIPTFSTWNNPEPELVLIVDSRGTAVGATLGNDVNLRDVEGRSALLLGKAKDNNAQSSIGPFIRVFDENFSLEDAGNEEIHLRVTGEDGFTLEGTNSVSQISRPLSELISATSGAHHQYPDGFALYTGTLFAPTQDRDTPGTGFTHKPGDVVEIYSTHLGRLVNTTGVTDQLPPWVFGIRELMAYLRRQGV
jgi:fumarylacetoacetate (FAA) hydrolase family protein